MKAVHTVAQVLPNRRLAAEVRDGVVTTVVQSEDLMHYVVASYDVRNGRELLAPTIIEMPSKQVWPTDVARIPTRR